MAMDFQRTTDAFGKIYSLNPAFAKWFPNRSGFAETRKVSNKLYDYFKRRIDCHMDTYDESHERDFIDMYVKQMKAAEERGETSTFNCEPITRAICDCSILQSTISLFQMSS